jgi:hypothetical protein
MKKPTGEKIKRIALLHPPAATNDIPEKVAIQEKKLIDSVKLAFLIKLTAQLAEAIQKALNADKTCIVLKKQDDLVVIQSLWHRST